MNFSIGGSIGPLRASQSLRMPRMSRGRRAAAPERVRTPLEEAEHYRFIAEHPSLAFFPWFSVLSGAWMFLSIFVIAGSGIESLQGIGIWWLVLNVPWMVTAVVWGAAIYEKEKEAANFYAPVGQGAGVCMTCGALGWIKNLRSAGKCPRCATASKAFRP